MTYWALNAAFLAVAALVAVAAALRRRAPGWRALLVAAIVLLLTTAVFDNVMIGIGLVDYNPALISGAFIGRAPLEDFAYAVVAVVLLPSLWHLLGSATVRPSASSGPSASSAPSASAGPSASSATGSGEPRA
ncbi:MAG: lycopene cyclase [Microbacteriaceae bacterium]|jgi:lycopene cyclase domain-containing protein|nr:lycopene cyclase [Microbacteriaceae bacterium]